MSSRSSHRSEASLASSWWWPASSLALAPRSRVTEIKVTPLLLLQHTLWAPALGGMKDKYFVAKQWSAEQVAFAFLLLRGTDRLESGRVYLPALIPLTQ